MAKGFSISTNGEQIHVVAPYNAEFARKMRLLGGEWTGGVWVLEADVADVVRAEMKKRFGRDDNPCTLCTVKVTFKESVSKTCGPVTIFGRTIAKASSRDSGATLGEGVSFLELEPSSGGSMKNWTTYIPAGAEILIRNIPEGGH